jgi:hypothetical protein
MPIYEVMRTVMCLASLFACVNSVAAALVSLLAGNVHRRLLISRRDGQRRNLHDIAIER